MPRERNAGPKCAGWRNVGMPGIEVANGSDPGIPNWQDSAMEACAPSGIGCGIRGGNGIPGLGGAPTG